MESLSKRLVEGSPDCIKVLDLEGRLLSMNEGGMKVLEICDITPYIGSSWIDFWRGADREAAQAAVKAARDGGIGRFVGFFPTTETHKPMWFDVMVSPIADATGKPQKLLAASRDVTAWKRSDQLLHAIIDGTSTDTGREFFQSLVEKLAKGLGVKYSFVAECVSDDRARSLAFWSRDKPGPDFEYDLRDKPLVEMRAESYLGVPLRDSA